MSEADGQPTTPAIDAIQATGVAHRVVRTERASSAEESAHLQGIETRQLLRTIVVRRGEGDYLFILVPAGRRFDWAKAVTGYERYTITPFGSTTAWPVVADAAILEEPVVAIGGGGFGVSVHLAPADLVRALDAQVADVSVAEPAHHHDGETH